MPRNGDAPAEEKPGDDRTNRNISRSVSLPISPVGRKTNPKQIRRSFHPRIILINGRRFAPKPARIGGRRRHGPKARHRPRSAAFGGDVQGEDPAPQQAASRGHGQGSTWGGRDLSRGGEKPTDLPPLRRGAGHGKGSAYVPGFTNSRSRPCYYSGRSGCRQGVSTMHTSIFARGVAEDAVKPQHWSLYSSYRHPRRGTPTSPGLSI